MFPRKSFHPRKLTDQVPHRFPTFLLILTAAILLLHPLKKGFSLEKENAPNIVVILADDLGYGDLACYGNQVVKTPHLDRFAKEGIRLTSCYSAAPNCSPARTGLMTGRTPYRVGVYNWIPMFSPMHVPQSETTLATLLKQNGYATAHCGKWHLNGRFNLSGQPQPSDHGFDHWFSTQNNALPNHHDPDNFVRNGKPVGKLTGYAADLVAEEASSWITEKRDKSKPFFLFVCFHEPHEPIASAAKYTEMYAQFNDPARAAHHGNITQMDAAFGRLMKTLDQENLRENTVVLFTSDNGPAITSIHPNGSAGPLRSKKGFLYEGGIRVPGMIRWPEKIPAGTESDEPVCGVDLLPTVCKLTGCELPNRPLDGSNILPMFAGDPISRKTPLYWQFHHVRSGPQVAMRIGDWKIVGYTSGKNPPPTADVTPEAITHIKTATLESFELYNLKEDIGETKNLAEQEPARLKEMVEKLQVHYKQIQKENPDWPAWTSPRYESKRIIWETDARKQQPKSR